MDKTAQRAAAIAANKLLAAAGYNPKGVSLKAAARKQQARRAAGLDDPRQYSRPLKQETPIKFPDGMTPAQRKAYRKEIMVARGEAYISKSGEFITAKEQAVRRKRAIAKARKVAGAGGLLKP